MAEKGSFSGSALPISGKRAGNCGQLTRSPSKTAIGGKHKQATGCIRATLLACYAYTLAKEVNSQATEAARYAQDSSKVARQLSHISENLTKQVQKGAGVNLDNQMALTEMYYSSREKPQLSLYAFLRLMNPDSQDHSYDKVGPDRFSPQSTSSGTTTASSDGCNVFSLPQIKRIKSITELQEISENMIKTSDKRRKRNLIGSQNSLSPLLAEEDVVDVKVENPIYEDFPAQQSPQIFTSQKQKHGVD
ncbi:unnamed protein product [Clavelina lepadiformis]|uniref:Uncharacterized protein n=1 Tax=Clavelina lepadiformis TaxID=159417 RepID=A0ABP0FYW8_CLALP